MTPIADAHCHFFSRTFFTRLLAERGPEAGGTPEDVLAPLGVEVPGEPEELADRWVRELDQAGVGRAALLASVPGDEASVAAAVRRHPLRFVGFFFLDPTQPDAATRVDRAFDEHGLRTACLLPAMQRCMLWDERVLRVVDRVATHTGAALFVHCGALSVGIRRKLGLVSRFETRFGNPVDLQAIALRHPHLPIIVPHFGAGFFREALLIADLCPNVYFDTSSSNGWIRYHPGLTLQDVFARALDVLGPSRLLFGTDSSFFPRGWQRAVFEQQAAVLDALRVPASAREPILGGNFARLFPLPA